MHKIDSDGATTNNLFTEGNAALSVPATVVSAAIANAWQQELVNVIEGVGITLLTSATDTNDQLNLAIKKLISQGGLAAPIQAPLANETAAAAVVGFPALAHESIAATQTENAVQGFKSLEAFFTVERSTDSEGAIETGRLYCTYSNKTQAWVVDSSTSHGDAGIYFSEGGGALLYTTDSMAGGSYVGNVKFTDIKVITV